jgi:hypothetical protein
MIKIMTSFFIFIMLAASSPFIGSWKLIPEKSKAEAGAPPPSGNVVMSYVEEGDHVKVVASVTLPDGSKKEIIHTQTYDAQPHDRFEGKPNGETLTHRRIDERTEETTWRKDGKIIIVTTRTVSADGKTLTSVVRVPGKTEPENVMVYERQ